MKIENQSRKGSHKLDGVAVGRIGTFPTGLSESEAEADEPANHKDGIEHCDWFILPLLLATPTMQFSLDRKQRSTHTYIHTLYLDTVKTSVTG